MDLQNATVKARGNPVLSFTSRTRIDELIASLTRVPAAEHAGVEKRKEPRYTVTTEVIVQPLDRSLHTEGQAFPATTRNISRGGIALLVRRVVEAPFVGIRFTMARGLGDTELLVRVLRCESIGNYYDLGGSFLTVWSD